MEALLRSPQKMSDHRVAHIFRFARAFAPKPQHIALSPRPVRTNEALMWRSMSLTKLNHRQGHDPGHFCEVAVFGKQGQVVPDAQLSDQAVNG